MPFRYLGLLLIFALPAHCNAQDFFPDGSQHQKWEYVVWNFFGGVCERRIVVTGDSVALCGKTYVEVLDCNGNEANCYLSGYYRLQNDSVMVRSRVNVWSGNDYTTSADCNQPEGLMYDFFVPTGDSLICQLNSAKPGTTFNFRKLEERIVYYEGIQRQKLTMSFRPYPANPNANYVMLWISGIGSNIHPFYSLSCIGDACEWEQQLTRVYRNGTLIYQDTLLDFSYSCNSWKDPTPIPPLDISDWVLYPNPVADYFTIKSGLPYGETFGLELYDPWGRLVLSEKEHPVMEGVFINNLSPGVYYLRLRYGGALRCFSLIKE